jgi:iron-sulfur cluster assembly protein
MTNEIVTLTDAAREHFETQIGLRDDGWGIYIGVRTAGCSGLAYVVEFWDDKMCNGYTDRPGRPHTTQGIPVVIDPAHYIYLQDMEIDYVVEGLQTGLKFNNPNSKSECGCGESIQF